MANHARSRGLANNDSRGRGYDHSHGPVILAVAAPLANCWQWGVRHRGNAVLAALLGLGIGAASTVTIRDYWLQTEPHRFDVLGVDVIPHEGGWHQIDVRAQASQSRYCLRETNHLLFNLGTRQFYQLGSGRSGAGTGYTSGQFVTSFITPPWMRGEWLYEARMTFTCIRWPGLAWQTTEATPVQPVTLR